jgi:hypothetical protein
LQAIVLACQQPLLLAKGCELLRDAFSAAGAVQAALMYHHISLGEAATDSLLRAVRRCKPVTSRWALHAFIIIMCCCSTRRYLHHGAYWCAVIVCCFARLRAGASTTQRQLMLAASQLSRKKKQASPTAACTENAPLAQQMQLSSYAEVLRQAATAAGACCRDVSDQSAKLQAVGEAVDSVAANWLSNLLQQLPQGTAVCTISRQVHSNMGSTDSLLISRVTYDAAQCSLSSALLVRLPPPAQGDR